MSKSPENISIIIQARMGSTRLPGKVLKELAGRPMLLQIINRLNFSKMISDVVVATTDLPEDDPVEKLCEENNIKFFRGSSEDVLSRYYETAKKFSSEIIIRITADCPVIDPEVIDEMLKMYLKNNTVDFLSNTLNRSFPRGLDAEIFSFPVLEKAHKEAEKKYQREHVTPYIYENPNIFTLKNFEGEKNYSFHRWTVDTKEDFELIEKIYKELHKPGEIFLIRDILQLFESNPDLIKINQSVQQKKIK